MGDDFIGSSLLEYALDNIDKYDLDAFIFRFKAFRSQEDLYHNHDTDKLFFYDDKGAVSEILKGGKFRGSCWNRICKRQLYEQVKFPVGRKYGEDIYVTYFIMSKLNKCAFCDKTYYYYRIRSSSAMHGKISANVFYRVKTYEEMVLWVTEKYPDLSHAAYNAFCTAVIDTTVMLKNAENPEVVKTVSAQISGSVRKHFRGIMKSSVKKSVKVYMMIYALHSRLYLLTMKARSKIKTGENI